MTDHEKAGRIEHLISSFMQIKKLVTSDRVDEICLDGVTKLYELAENEGVQQQLDEIHRRRIDPTN